MLFNQASMAVVPTEPPAVFVAPETAAWPVDWQVAQRDRTLSFEISSQHTGQRYRILLGLPACPAPKAGYPAVWALDGMASFPIMEVVRPQLKRCDENKAWRTMKRPSDGLIVAIAHVSGKPFDVDARALDYTPFTTAKTGDLFSSKHGGADQFLRFITEELRPLVARHFALNWQQQTLFGFSYGGLFTLYTLSTQPQHFQRYWAASPSLWFGENQTLKRLPQQLKKIKLAGYVAKVFITVGLDEQYPVSFSSPEVEAKLGARTMVDNAEQFARMLSDANGDESVTFDVSFHSLPAHDHHDMLMHGARRVLDFAFAQ
jgi:predicted alpha/beta superfamily hydrolase